jgi:thiol-disulfide isomerase/thioredoxin
LEDYGHADALLVMFLCAHCPYVKHVEQELAKLGRDYEGRGLAIVAIGSNDPVRFPDDAAEKLAEQAERVGFGFPYLFDESQEVAKAYTAACTPDFFLFDGAQELAYCGQLDDSRPRNAEPVTGASLRFAIDAVLEGRTVPEDQKPSMGCGIKWKPGNEPMA